MDVLEAIHTRRSVGKTRPELPPREVIDEILEAATWAPNHYLNEPWRFFVMAGEERERFGDVLAEDALRSMPQATDEQRRAVAEAQRKKATRSPVVIAVAVDPPEGGKVVEVENLAAVSCAVQNMLLAAHAHGLAVKWSTGEAARSDTVKAFFGLTPRHHILAFLYLGYPAEEPGAGRRTPPAAKTTWLGWPEHVGVGA